MIHLEPEWGWCRAGDGGGGRCPKYLVRLLQPHLLQQDLRHSTHPSLGHLLSSSSAHPHPGRGKVLEVHKLLRASLLSLPRARGPGGCPGATFRGAGLGRRREQPSVLRGVKKNSNKPGDVRPALHLSPLKGAGFPQKHPWSCCSPVTYASFYGSWGAWGANAKTPPPWGPEGGGKHTGHCVHL